MKTHEMGRKNILFFVGVLFLGLSLVVGSSVAFAKSAVEIDTSVDVALEQFNKDIKGGTEFLKSAKGVLVLPSVVKAGIGVGGEYGEGALRIDGKTVDYYSTAAASIGFQLGVFFMGARATGSMYPMNWSVRCALSASTYVPSKRSKSRNLF